MKKKFTYDETEFLFKLLKNLIESPHGCHVPGTDIKCPYWDMEQTNTANPDMMGECTMKKSNRVCTKLELPLVEDSLVTEVRPKVVEDYAEEIEEEQKFLKSKMGELNQIARQLSADKASLQIQLEKIEQKKKALLGEKNDPKRSAED